MAQTLEFNGSVRSVTPIVVPTLDDDMVIIQKLDDEPNDVGGLTAAELKAEFDKAGENVKKYINNELVPAVVAGGLTEQNRADAEAERVANEVERVESEESRISAESARLSAEQIRAEAESVRVAAEETRVSAENGRDSAESSRVAAEQARVEAEAERANEATGYVARSGVAANNAEVYAEGGNLKEFEELPGGGFTISMTTMYTQGAKQYAEEAAAAANGGTYTSGSFTFSETGATRYADKAKAYAEGGTYQEYDVRQSFGSATLNSFTVSKGAKQYAEEAKESASDAFSHKTSARTDAQEASRFASSARTSASNAQTYATSAKNANSSAESAKTAAESAKTAAESAKAAAESAKIAAEKARDEAQTAAGGGSGLPAHTSADNGKFLRIVDGAPAWATVQNAEEVSF